MRTFLHRLHFHAALQTRRLRREISHLDRRTIIVGTLSGLAIVLLISLVVSFGVLNHTEGQKKLNNVIYSYPVQDAATADSLTSGRANLNGIGPDFLFIKAGVNSIDPLNSIVKLHCSFYPNGDLTTSGGSEILQRPLKSYTQVIFDDRTLHFSRGAIIPSMDIAVSVPYGNPNSYPFDKYKTGIFYLSAVTYKLVNGTREEKVIPVVLGIFGSQFTWHIEDPKVKDEYKNGTLISVDMEISRAYTTRVFAVFVFFMLWSISLLVFLLTVSIWTRNRKVEPPTLAVITSTLFAIPALRNSQPGITTIGCTTDVIGFMWNMVLAATAVSLVLLNYIVKFQRERLPPLKVVAKPQHPRFVHQVQIKKSAMDKKD